MMQGNFDLSFLSFDSCLGLYVIYAIFICIQHYILLYSFIYIRYILFKCVSIFSLIDYVYVDTAIRYMPSVFPVSPLLPFVPQFLQTRLDSSFEDVVNEAYKS